VKYFRMYGCDAANSALVYL